MKELVSRYPVVAFAGAGCLLVAAMLILSIWWPTTAFGIFITLWWPQSWDGGGLDFLSYPQTVAVSFSLILACAAAVQARLGSRKPGLRLAAFIAFWLVLVPPIVLFWGAFLLFR